MKNIFISMGVVALIISCKSKEDSNVEKVSIPAILENIERENAVKENVYSPESKITYYTSALNHSTNLNDSATARYFLANTLLTIGKEDSAIHVYDQLLKQLTSIDKENKIKILKEIALCWMRIGERTNCIANHNAHSCIFPIQANGIHTITDGSKHAIKIYEQLLNDDPNDLESRWLVNIAYMTINGYPGKVPPAILIKGLNTDSVKGIKPFIEIAGQTGLNTKNLAGGSIIEDFNNDGYPDIVTSSLSLKENMHYNRNNGNGTFTDLSVNAGLRNIMGGLNMMQTDYNNDGLKDIFVLRGGWKGVYGKEPNSLLRNNGNGSFTDVTAESGLLSYHPTQTATWADFNNDGWLDLFIGNEAQSPSDHSNACELYLNNQDGTFREAAAEAHCNINAYVKGVTSGDYDNDGLTDIFISSFNGDKYLLKNMGVQNGQLKFANVSDIAGFSGNKVSTFPTWFWDYDNDGWLDILVCSYDHSKSLAWYSAAEALGIPPGAGKIFLYHNKQDGTFEEVSSKLGINSIAFAMGSNFGDIDNDGYLDFYLGTGNPDYSALVPNKLFKNIEGKSFVDITTAARVGNLQKGHGVSFADLDYDGDLDIYMDMGGAYTGDAYENSLYMNPGQNNNNWINITLIGVKTNKVAIGSRIQVTFTENGIQRSVYRDVNSGGSFGCNPLMQHIGIGQAKKIDRITIIWPVGRVVQEFKNLTPGETLIITEGNSQLEKLKPHKVNLLSSNPGPIDCAPF
jgi:hypothetical protein